VFTYSGDTPGIEVEQAAEADILLHEATYLAGDCPPGNLHCSFEKALRIGKDAHVRTLVLFHVSDRYKNEELVRTVAELVDTVGLDCPVYLIWRHRLIRLGS
jgi:ribonuclease BN (tRNA processing enzyme)